MSANRILELCEIIVSLVMGIFLGLAISDYFEGSEGWLFRWQTIVAGLLAIVAAGLTMIAMFATDARAGRRHDQVVTLNLRSDRLRIQRLKFGNALDLHLWAREVRKLRNDFVDRLQPGEGLRMTNDDFRNLESLSGKLDSILKTVDAANASDLFMPSMADDYYYLKLTRDALAQHESFLGNGLEGPVTESIRGRIERIFGMLNDAEHPADTFADGLDKLSETYEQFVLTGQVATH
jgi:hypothetical protein